MDLGAIHQGRPAYPGGGGLGKPDIYCYFQRNSMVKPGQMGEGGLKNLIFAGRPCWMAPYTCVHGCIYLGQSM